MSNIKPDNLGPILKNITYVPDYTINTYTISYNLPTDTNIVCHENGNPRSTSDSSIKFIYEYDTTIKNIYNNDNPNAIDVYCNDNNDDNKQFLGWSRNINDETVPQIKATSNIELYPIFIDKIPVKIYVNNILITTVNFNSGFNLESNNQTLQTTIANSINQQNLKNNYDFTEEDNNNYKLYSDDKCTILFTNRIITASLNLYIKASPYITFQLGNDSTLKFSDNTTAPKKISLSELSNGSKTTPSVNVSNQHAEFDKWQRLNNSQYPAFLSAGSRELQNHGSINQPETYTASTKPKQYSVIFQDKDNNCVPTPYPKTILVDANTTLTKNNSNVFQSLNCTKAGHTFNGWKEEFTTRSYCPAINLLIYIVAIVIIAIIVKYLSDGFSNSKFRRSILFSSSKQ